MVNKFWRVVLWLTVIVTALVVMKLVSGAADQTRISGAQANIIVENARVNLLQEARISTNTQEVQRLKSRIVELETKVKKLQAELQAKKNKEE